MKNEHGQGLAEYAVVIGIMLLVIVVFVALIAPNLAKQDAVEQPSVPQPVISSYADYNTAFSYCVSRHPSFVDSSAVCSSFAQTYLIILSMRGQ